jgi:hypothetical protein
MKTAKTDVRFSKTDVRFSKTDVRFGKTDVRIGKTDVRFAVPPKKTRNTEWLFFFFHTVPAA